MFLCVKILLPVSVSDICRYQVRLHFLSFFSANETHKIAHGFVYTILQRSITILRLEFCWVGNLFSCQGRFSEDFIANNISAECSTIDDIPPKKCLNCIPIKIVTIVAS